jgi:hypothetical protein
MSIPDTLMNIHEKLWNLSKHPYYKYMVFAMGILLTIELAYDYENSKLLGKKSFLGKYFGIHINHKEEQLDKIIEALGE